MRYQYSRDPTVGHVTRPMNDNSHNSCRLASLHRKNRKFKKIPEINHWQQAPRINPRLAPIHSGFFPNFPKKWPIPKIIPGSCASYLGSRRFPPPWGFCFDNADQRRRQQAFIALALVRRTSGLRAFLVGILRNRDLAAEVLQTTFSRALEEKNSPREESLRGWLFQVAFREALALKRRQKIHVKSLGGLAWIKPTAAESSESSASRAEMIDKVRLASESLR
jgi:hypothetical protein